MYETTGRFGDFDKPNYGNWESDLDYLNEHYFGHPCYLRISDRPVLFVYLSREYFRGQGQAEIENARRRNGGLYIIGDDVFGGEYRSEWARQLMRSQHMMCTVNPSRSRHDARRCCLISRYYRRARGE